MAVSQTVLGAVAVSAFVHQASSVSEDDSGWQ